MPTSTPNRSEPRTNGFRTLTPPLGLRLLMSLHYAHQLRELTPLLRIRPSHTVLFSILLIPPYYQSLPSTRSSALRQIIRLSPIPRTGEWATRTRSRLPIGPCQWHHIIRSPINSSKAFTKPSRRTATLSLASILST